MTTGPSEKGANCEDTVLVLAPYGRDGTLTRDVLRQAHIDAEACTTMEELCARIPATGAAVITAEALMAPSARALLMTTLAAQPPWSDYPLLVFAAPGVGTRAEDVRALGNATLLERPIGVRAVVSAVEGALRARRRQYEGRAAIRQRDNFLAMLGHELRNPLAAIRFAVGGIARTQDPDKLGRHVSVIDRQSQHLSRLVDDLLDVARVTTGRIELNKRALDLGDLVDRCVSLFEPLAAAAGLTLSVERAEGTATVDGDVVRLEQIVNNLLTNAVKYTPSGGRVDVIVSREDGTICVRVRDTGVGIPAETLPHVFDLFVQAPSTLERARGGLGIGLTLVRSLTLLHGGSVEAHSEGNGSGTEMVVRLPVSAKAAVAGARAAPPAIRRRVLVVDDSVDVRDSLRDVLEDLGHDVVTASDGAGGLARLLELVPTVAIIDIGLPGMDGYAVAREARRALGDRVRLVALTGYGQPEDKQRARDAGFDAHFTKPVDVEALEGLLANPH